MRAVFSMLLLSACSEYDLEPPLPPELGPNESSEELAEDEPVDLEPEEDGIPDDFGTVDCEDGFFASWLSGEVVVLSYDAGPSVGVLNSPLTGSFHIYDVAPAESGAAQRNESMYLRITNPTESVGMPTSDNCGGDFIVVDPDNQGTLPSGTTQYLGTFWLEAGDNNVEIWHACPRMRDGECRDHHIDEEPTSTCESGSVNSVHVTGQAICLMPA
jgi:hypothetical protein